ncbi:basic amino acid ABC transporter substrate-binding protein [Cellulomonas sp. P24]|uniref:basic amino acid ABC transporter substrate-binding protein n=1 Tax=Cellulomonas sp. P24 TaxID=2885206 RepID=UPI00216AB918|nr:basic amino acid ABC transporter substrate-binding protein [Cellulomonas sp. P24]MCR6491408.1 basic amino acid ABC transporter substrate-binding protein [Cellulomonas sp. P24]
MRTSLRLAAPLVAGAMLLAGCSSTSTPAASSSAAGGVTLVKAGTLTVCTNPPYEPFEYTDASGKVVGFDIDLTNEVAKDLGVTLTTVVSPFESIQSGVALDTNTCDIVASGITITPEREAKIDFSDPYFNADQGLLVKAGSSLKTAADLVGKKVAVQQATTGETWAKDHNLDAVQFEDLGLQVQALQTGQVDAVINDVAVLGPFVKQGYSMNANFSTGEKYGLGVKKGNTALLDAVNKTLARVQSDGTYTTLYTKNIGTAPSAS